MSGGGVARQSIASMHPIATRTLMNTIRACRSPQFPVNKTHPRPRKIGAIRKDWYIRYRALLSCPPRRFPVCLPLPNYCSPRRTLALFVCVWLCLPGHGPQQARGQADGIRTGGDVAGGKGKAGAFCSKAFEAFLLALSFFGDPHRPSASASASFPRASTPNTSRCFSCAARKHELPTRLGLGCWSCRSRRCCAYWLIVPSYDVRPANELLLPPRQRPSLKQHL